MIPDQSFYLDFVCILLDDEAHKSISASELVLGLFKCTEHDGLDCSSQRSNTTFA